MEPIFHVACLTWGYVAVIIGLALDIFNPIATQNLRSFGVAPPGCKYIPEDGMYAWSMLSRIWICFSIALVTVISGLLILSFTLVVYNLQSQLRRNQLYEFHGLDHSNRIHTRGEMQCSSAVQISVTEMFLTSH
jgi:hypothetical protein